MRRAGFALVLAVATGLMLLAIASAGCAPCAVGMTRCGAAGPEVCTGRLWRGVLDCADLGLACQQPDGGVASCLPVGTDGGAP